MRSNVKFWNKEQEDKPLDKHDQLLGKILRPFHKISIPLANDIIRDDNIFASESLYGRPKDIVDVCVSRIRLTDCYRYLVATYLSPF